MKVLITGARGLVGRSISERLENRKEIELLCLGRKECNLELYSETINIFKSFSPDVVVHCAGKVFGIGGNMANQYNSWSKNTIINIHQVFILGTLFGNVLLMISSSNFVQCCFWNAIVF